MKAINKVLTKTEKRVDRSALDLNDLVKLMRDVSFTGEAKLGCDAIDALARAIERVEEDLWATVNDLEAFRLGRNEPTQAA